jgi:hypothetical protein
MKCPKCHQEAEKLEENTWWCNDCNKFIQSKVKLPKSREFPVDSKTRPTGEVTTSTPKVEAYPRNIPTCGEMLDEVEREVRNLSGIKIWPRKNAATWVKRKQVLVIINQVRSK